jgi:hypothetical protein
MTRARAAALASALGRVHVSAAGSLSDLTIGELADDVDVADVTGVLL